MTPFFFDSVSLFGVVPVLVIGLAVGSYRPPIGGWTRWDAGWLLTYIAAYLLALLPVRWLLRIP